jgi:hypothetical protein
MLPFVFYLYECLYYSYQELAALCAGTQLGDIFHTLAVLFAYLASLFLQSSAQQG